MTVGNTSRPRSNLRRAAIRVVVARREFSTTAMHIYEIRPRKDRRGVDLISDVLPFARLC